MLVNRPARYSRPSGQRIRDSVGQAAPVLANLRNLAIAELRAATDSLTGLPNKRASPTRSSGCSRRRRAR